VVHAEPQLQNAGGSQFGRLSQSRGGTPIDVRLAIQARPWPTPRQKSLAVCGRFASDIFLFVLPFRQNGVAKLAYAGHPCESDACE
jgi:hypothetical protein